MRASGGGLTGPDLFHGWKLGRFAVLVPGALSHRFLFGWEGSPTKTNYRKKRTLVPTSQIWRDLAAIRFLSALDVY